MNDTALPTREEIQAWDSARRMDFVNKNRSRVLAQEEVSDATLDLCIFALRCERVQPKKAAGKAKKEPVPQMSVSDL